MPQLQPFTNIVLAGGARRIIATVGCLKYIEEQNQLHLLKNVVGVSAGSVVGALIVMGYTVSEMIEFLYHSMKNNCTLDPLECLNIFTTYGLNSGDMFERTIEDMIVRKFGEEFKDMTFLQLAKKTGKNLVVTVSNMTKEKCEFFYVDTKPDMKISLAIRMSCTIPIMFKPIVMDDQLYLDGGLFNNFPMDFFDENANDVLGINLVYTNYKKMDSFPNYLMFIIYSMIVKANPSSCNAKNIINIEFDDDEWFSMNDMKIITPKEIWIEYVKIGHNKMKSLYSKTDETN